MIIVLEDNAAAPSYGAKSLAKIVNAFKSWITREIRKNLASQGDAATNKLVYIFQPNYYEHIIRNERVLDKIRKYIENNPDIERPDWEELDK